MAAPVHFVICIRNEGFPASLEPRKVYQLLPDDSAAEEHLIRVIDESGEDYLFPCDLFVPISLPKEAGPAFAAAE